MTAVEALYEEQAETLDDFLQTKLIAGMAILTAATAALLTGSFFGHFDFGQQLGLSLPRGLNLSTSLLFEVSICLAVLGSASYMLDTLGHPGEEVK